MEDSKVVEVDCVFQICTAYLKDSLDVKGKYRQHLLQIR